jgi:hypothetical protein
VIGFGENEILGYINAWKILITSVDISGSDSSESMHCGIVTHEQRITLKI